MFAVYCTHHHYTHSPCVMLLQTMLFHFNTDWFRWPNIWYVVWIQNDDVFAGSCSDH